VTLGAVADATRIARHHLLALERGDLDALPAGPFGRAYVRAYAEVLGIDPVPILEAYRLQEKHRGHGTAEDERRMLEELSDLVERRAGSMERPSLLAAWTGLLAAAFVAFGILLAAGWFLTRARAPEAAGTTSPPPSGPASPEVGARRGPAPVESGAPGEVGAGRGGGATAGPPPASPPTDALRAPDHGVGTGLVDRRLVGRADRFSEGTRVSFWTRVLGGQPGHVIRHVWFQEGRAVMRADLPIGGPHWRTHSSLLLPGGSAGRWTVEARTSDGRLLARDAFLCEPGRGPEGRRP
jgi:hypothetical protein